MDEPGSSIRQPSPPGDAELGTPERVPDAEADPRALAAAQSGADIVKAHSSPTVRRGAPGRTEVPYGTGRSTAEIKQSAQANPLTGQRARGAAGEAGERKGAEGTAPPDAADPKEAGAQKVTPERAGATPQGTAGRRGDLAGKGKGAAASLLQSDTGQESLHTLGKAADQAAHAAADRYAPGVYGALKSSKPGKAAVDRLQRSRLGQKVPPAFFEGFRGEKRTRTGEAGKGGKGGSKKESGSGEGSGSGRGKYVLMAAAASALIPVLCLLLVFALIVGVGFSDDDGPTQPGEDSDARVAKYLPAGWQDVLEGTAQGAENSGAEDYAIVPWTILGGIAAAQTDFARYSPYDNVDRDPGRKSTQVPLGGDGESGAAVTARGTSGAGPGPVSGVTGAGSAAGVGHGHQGPPAGDLGHQLGWFMYALRMHESNGDYTAGKGKGGACGAYQYMNSTWRQSGNNYAGYSTACDAPASVQDRRARQDILTKWNQYHKWQEVAAAHFYPRWAQSPQNWDKCPAACGENPTVWDYVDDIMKRMRKVSAQYPAGSGGPAVQPAAYSTGTGGPSGGLSPGLYADGCPVANPDPDIGGKGRQGTGPYLLTPAAAGQMTMAGLDPQSPCDSAAFVAQQLSVAATTVHADPDGPQWKPDGTADDQANARKYWSKVIDASGIFVDRAADPDAPCAPPPPDDPEKPWSVSYKIISIWRCETTRMPELYLVTGARVDDAGKVRFTVQSDRAAATETLVDEALSVSYGAGKWKTDKCDNSATKRQGVFPMTKKEAKAAGVTDRCDADKNIEGAARLVLSVEKEKPGRRPHGLGPFQPMVGGWQKLGIAMGRDLDLFSLAGPGRTFTASKACTDVMTGFLKAVAPHAPAFAKLTDPPGPDEAFGEWEPKLVKAEKANGITDPGDDPACRADSWAPGYDATLAQIAAGLAGGGANSDNLTGLGNYYQGREDRGQEIEPVAGEDSLVVPRLALRAQKEIGAPVAPDATEAWSSLGTTAGVTVPLAQVAVEYAWFFGGVVSPFNSAGKLIGSLADGSGATAGAGAVPVSVDPRGCPKNAPRNTLRDGAKKIGVHKLCVDSLARVRTPAAAKAIKWALTHLGLHYSQARRNDNGYADCSSFVSRAYRDSGAIPDLYPKGSNAPVTGTFLTAPWMHRISLSQARPGDLLEPNPGHVAMQLADGYKVHTNLPGDVSKVERSYSAVSWAGWVDPSKV